MQTENNDSIVSVKLSKILVPLDNPVSDAKVLTGRQTRLENVAILLAEIETEQGAGGFGFSYALRIGGAAQYAHACELAPLLLGQDPNDISRIWDMLLWAGASVGRSGISVQAMAAFDIALWDLKAKRAGLSLSKLIGSFRDSVPCYNSSGGYLQAPIEEVIDKARASLERGIGGIKLKVGQPDIAQDLNRIETLRRELGDDIPLMVDANQQWNFTTALRFGRNVAGFDLTWIEEPLNAYDTEGHAALAARLDTPIATGEMLAGVYEHEQLIANRSIAILQPDAPRIGGITPFLQLADSAHRAGLGLAPHFVMEIHIHLAACYPQQPWVEHFEWLEPLFNERIKICDGKMVVPTGHGLGFSISPAAREWTRETATFNRQ